MTTHVPIPATDGSDAWRLDAACAELDPEIFFAGDDATKAQAMEVCKACPVRRDCLETALSLGEMHGIWGGTTESQRRRMIRARRRELREARAARRAA